MPKFFGVIGYEETVENPPGSGVWVENIVERRYSGDVVRNNRRLDSTQQVNDNLRVSSSISIVADQYAYAHFHAMRYIEYLGTKWKIESADASTPPRIVVELGGRYNT